MQNLADAAFLPPPQRLREIEQALLSGGFQCSLTQSDELSIFYEGKLFSCLLKGEGHSLFQISVNDISEGLAINHHYALERCNSVNLEVDVGKLYISTRSDGGLVVTAVAAGWCPSGGDICSHLKFILDDLTQAANRFCLGLEYFAHTDLLFDSVARVSNLE